MNNLVSIITVNYNGKKLLKDFLTSAFDQDYPSEKYEVIVVDNGSIDGSEKFIKENFPKTKIVISEVNLGFGGGNNLGMEKAGGDLFLLANNDTILGKDTLSSLVKRFNSSPTRVGAIAAKLVLADSYLPFLVEEAFFSGYSTPEIAKPYSPEAYIISHDSGSLFTEKVFVPISYKLDKGIKIHLDIKPFRRNDFRIFLGTDIVYKGHINSLTKDFGIDLDLSSEKLAKYKENLIQNAGNFFFRDGSGRDRGALIAVNKQFYEEDNNRYDSVEEVPGFCGAGVLLNKKALEEVGYFDRNFFMYYEDSDLSFRLREKGWKIIYSPATVIRHIHAGSSKEWSDFFIFNAERGRLFFVSRHWPRFKVLELLTRYVARDTFGFLFYNLAKKNWEKVKNRTIIRLRVCLSLIPGFFIGLLRPRRLKYSDLKQLF